MTVNRRQPPAHVLHSGRNGLVPCPRQPMLTRASLSNVSFEFSLLTLFAVLLHFYRIAKVVPIGVRAALFVGWRAAHAGQGRLVGVALRPFHRLREA
jgi:hypothetical protein